MYKGFVIPNVVILILGLFNTAFLMEVIRYVVPENDPLLYSRLVKTASIICLLIIWINLFWVCRHWKDDKHTSATLATIVHALFWTFLVVLNVFFSVGLLS